MDVVNSHLEARFLLYILSSPVNFLPWKEMTQVPVCINEISTQRNYRERTELGRKLLM